MTATAKPSLTEEMLTYRAAHPELVEKHLGEYVVVKGYEVIVGFDSFVDAVSEGVMRFGANGQFHVQLVREQDPTDLLLDAIANCPCCQAEAESSSRMTSVTDNPPRLPRAERRRLQRDAARRRRR